MVARKSNKKPATGEYRNLVKSTGLETYQFEVKVKEGWKLFTGLLSDDAGDREKFAQSTADAWKKR